MKNIVKISHTKTYFPQVKGSIRIISLSDLHFSKSMKIQPMRNLVNVILDLKPNYLFLLGDNLDTTNVLEYEYKKQEFLDWCEQLGTVAPTMISIADHDVRYETGLGMIEDFNSKFWNQVSSIPNVEVLNNRIYEDERIHVVGYTQPGYYFHRKYELPHYSKGSIIRNDEDASVLLEDMDQHMNLLKGNKNRLNEILFHSPLCLENQEIQKRLENFQHIYSGHMHGGLTPPILDDILPKTIGIISPQRTLFPKNARGIIRTRYGSLGIINGGITKIAESQKMILQPFNTFFPVHMDVVDTENCLGKVKTYARRSYYQIIK